MENHLNARLTSAIGRCKAHLIHSWSRLTPLHTVKVVVVGQDPYHGPKQACGHSFSVQKGVAVPASLKNIYKELSTEYGDQFQQPKHGCLDGWAKQGVLLLNACLTVQAGQAASHHGKGWEPFTKAVLKTIADEASKGATAKNSKLASMFSKQQQQQQSPPQKDKKASDEQGGTKGVVFLAWGLPAAKSLAEAGITDVSVWPLVAVCSFVLRQLMAGHNRKRQTSSSFARPTPPRCRLTVDSWETATSKRPTTGSRNGMAPAAASTGESFEQNTACSFPPRHPDVLVHFLSIINKMSRKEKRPKRERRRGAHCAQGVNAEP